MQSPAVAGAEFSNNWFQTTARGNWDHLVPKLRPRRIPEIGSYEGASTCYLIDELAGEQAVEIYSIDTWQGGVEHSGIDMGAVELRFDRKVARSMAAANHPVDVIKCKGSSALMLSQLLAQGHTETFDFVYVDGSHQAPDVLCDAVLAFRLLRTGGIIGFDDYLWSEPLAGGTDPVRCPKPAIDAFTTLYCRKLQVLSMPLYQLYALKTAA
ncbi:MAG: class I SAM-dependent methyltransferase [Rubrivivax sp.]|nr:class I SAM-dependent methyltransferase [Rubrivivax sp.]